MAKNFFINDQQSESRKNVCKPKDFCFAQKILLIIKLIIVLFSGFSGVVSKQKSKMGKGPGSTFLKKISKHFGDISPFCGAILVTSALDFNALANLK